MKVYIIHAIIDDNILYDNDFGQYDIFRDKGVGQNGLLCVMYAFTSEKSHLNRFLSERPVKGRYEYRVKKMSKEEFEEFRNDHYKLELRSIYLEIRPSTYVTFDKYTSHIMDTLPEGECPDNYVTRMMTLYELSVVTHNYDLIDTERKDKFFELHADHLPYDIDIFIEPLRRFLEYSGYLYDMLIYPDKILLEKYEDLYADVTNGFCDTDAIPYTISMFDAFIYVFYTMIIDRRVK